MQKEILANGVPNCYRKLVPDKRCGEAVARWHATNVAIVRRSTKKYSNMFSNKRGGDQ
jgi:hypothetical protein